MANSETRIDRTHPTAALRVAGAVVIAALAGTAAARAQVPAPSLALVGQVGGTSWAVAADGTRLVAGSGPRVVLLDAADPSALRVLGSSEPLGALPSAIVVRDGLAYVGAGGWLYVLDVSGDAAPTVLGQVVVGSVSGLDVRGDVAFVTGAAGLSAVDVSEAGDPWRAAVIGLSPGPYAIDVDGDHAYVASGELGLRVFDVADVGALRQVAVVDTPGNARSVVVHDGTAYVGDGYVVHGARASIGAIDVRVPTAPAELGRLELLDDPYGLAVAGLRLYVTNWGAGLVEIDVADPATPSLLTRSITPGMASGLAVAGGHAFVADDLDGLHAFALAAGAPPRLLRARPVLRYGVGIDVEGGFAFVAEGTRFAGGVRMFDVADPAALVEVAHVDTTGDPEAVPGPIDALDASGGYVYAVGYGNDGLHVLRVADGPSLEPVAHLPLRFARSVVVAGGIAYIPHQVGFSLVDISDAARPRLVGTIDVPNAYSVAVAGGFAYVVSLTDGVHVIDVSSPEQPVRATVIDVYARDVDVDAERSIAYVAGVGGLAVYDVADPRAPALLGSSILEGDLTSIDVDGDLAYVGRGQEGVAVVDIADPSAPTLLAAIDTLEFCKDLVFADGKMFVAGGRMGLGVVRLEGVPGATPSPDPEVTPTEPPVPTPTRRSAPDRPVYLPIALAAAGLGDSMSGPDAASRWTHYVDRNAITDLAADRARGEMWAATSTGVVAWGLNDGSYRIYTVAEGLADRYAHAVAVDQAGDRWFGTAGGLNRLGADGRLATYTVDDGLPGNAVYDILVTRDGARWFATDGGVAVLDSSAAWSRPARVDTLAAPAVALAEDPVTGDLWFAHGDAASGVTRRTTSGDWTRYDVADGLALPIVTAVAVDGTGTAWFATHRRHASDSGHTVEAAVVSRAPDGTWRRWPGGDGGLSATWPGGLLATTYFASLDAPPVATDPASETTAPLAWLGDACAGGVPAADLSGAVALLADGGCPHGEQVATAQRLGAAIAVIVALKQPDDPQHSALRPHRTSLAPSASIPALMIDAASGAALRAALDDGQPVTVTLDARPGPIDDDVTAIAVDDDGAPWFAAPGGVGRRRADGAWDVVADDPVLRDGWVSALAFDGGSSPWVGTQVGIRVRERDGTWTTRAIDDGLAGNSVRAIAIGEDGTAWVGTWAGGASRRAPDGRWTPFRRYPAMPWLPHRDDHFLGEGFVRAIAFDERTDMVWFGTDAGAVARAPDGSWTRYTEADGLVAGWIEAIHVGRDGRVWFATNRGVSVRAPDGAWRTFTPDDGLGSIFVRDIAEDRDGNLWFACSGGVSRLAPDGTWRTFTQDDGLQGSDGRAVAIDVDGTVWLGTNLGISRLRPDGTWQNYPTRSGVEAIAADLLRGGVWYGSRSGLEHRAGDAAPIRFTSADGLLEDFVRTVAVDARGLVWSGTLSSGVSVLDPRSP